MIHRLTALLLASMLLAFGQQPTEFTKVPVIKLRWDVPPPEDEGMVAGYRVHFGRESGNYTEIVNVGMVPRQVGKDGVEGMFSGAIELPGDGKWFCAVTVYNSFGLESDYSNEISFERSRPTAPDGLRVEVEIEVSQNLKDWESIAKVSRPLEDREFFRIKQTIVNQ